MCRGRFCTGSIEREADPSTRGCEFWFFRMSSVEEKIEKRKTRILCEVRDACINFVHEFPKICFSVRYYPDLAVHTIDYLFLTKPLSLSTKDA